MTSPKNSSEQKEIILANIEYLKASKNYHSDAALARAIGVQASSFSSLKQAPLMASNVKKALCNFVGISIFELENVLLSELNLNSRPMSTHENYEEEEEDYGEEEQERTSRKLNELKATIDSEDFEIIQKIFRDSSNGLKEICSEFNMMSVEELNNLNPLRIHDFVQICANSGDRGLEMLDKFLFIHTSPDYALSNNTLLEFITECATDPKHRLEKQKTKIISFFKTIGG